MKYLLTSLFSLVLFLSACSGSSLSPQEQAYYADMEQARSALKPIEQMSKSSSFARVRYQSAVSEMLPKTQSVLRKHKDSYSKRDSYQALFKAFESFIIAERLWSKDKGLSLVNKRLDEARNALLRFDQSIVQERNPEVK